MSQARVGLTAVAVASLVVLGMGCSAPDLPPAGPAPGDVDVGYGTRPAGGTTGAVTSVSENESVRAGVFNIEELLRGRIAGLQVVRTATGVQYRIRGQNSILNDQEPLFIVDGIPTTSRQLESALSGVVTEDIRQVDVLKDVASTSIYGMRGAGGVIIITTRR
jgi:TonB-dependent SusC/RagA subfamily outer membrane receptor